VQGDDIPMTARYPFENRNFIAYLRYDNMDQYLQINEAMFDEANHMFPSLHKLLVDNLAGIILARLNMNGLFHDRIRPAAESLARAVLPI
jgi:hypothetical protein